MAANAHNELADDEINRSADELKTAISNANVGDKIPAMDRFALDTQEWRSVVLERSHDHHYTTALVSTEDWGQMSTAYGSLHGKRLTPG